MFKDTAGQSLTVLAIDTATGLPKAGDAANITLYVSIDDGAVTVIADSSGHPSEANATNAKGDYTIPLAQAETNGSKLRFTGKSSTSGVVIIPQTIYTSPVNFPLLAITSGGIVSADIQTIKTQSVTCSAGVTVGPFVGNSTAAIAVNGSGKVSALLAATDVTGNLPTDVQTIKTQSVTCAAGVTIGVFLGNAVAALAVDASGRIDLGKILGTASAGAVGYVGIDWGHVNAPTTTVNLSGTTTNVVNTATNLTNAAGSGDLTATMKTSVTTAATAATPVATLGSAYDPAKGAAQATTALSNVVWTNTIASRIDAAISTAVGPAVASAISAADLQTRVPVALVAGGKMDASVGALGAGAITTSTIADGAITSAKIGVTAVSSALSTYSGLGIFEKIVAIWRKAFSKQDYPFTSGVPISDTVHHYADDGVTVIGKQTAADDGTSKQTLGPLQDGP